MLLSNPSNLYIEDDTKFNYPLYLSYLPLPKTKVDGNIFVRKASNLKITFSSSQSIPYGKWGDLSAMFLCTSANRMKMNNPSDRKIQFDSIYQILASLGYEKTSGYQQRCFYENLNLWTTLTINYELWDPREERSFRKNVLISDTSIIKYSDHNLNANESFLILSDMAFEFFTNNYMLVNAKNIAMIKSVFDLRVYLWISRRTFQLKDDLLVRWQDLMEQFGPINIAHARRFKNDFEKTLTAIKEKFMPDLKFKIDLKKGVYLYKERAKVKLDIEDKNVLFAPSPTPIGHYIPPGYDTKNVTYKNSSKELAFQHYLACSYCDVFPVPPKGTKAWNDLIAEFEKEYASNNK